VLELGLRLVVALALVLGLFWVVARTSARKMGGSRGLLRVHGRQSLSRTASVAVVEVGNRVLVVGVSDGGVRLLTELDPDEIAEPVVGRLVAASHVPDEAAPGLDPSVVRALSVSANRRTTGRHAVPSTGLSGSLLSSQTWKQAWAAATARTGSVVPAVSGGDGRRHD
jgi:flagellar protein FliO/FliZ